MMIKLNVRGIKTLIFFLLLFSACSGFKKEKNSSNLDTFKNNEDIIEKISNNIHDVELNGFFDYDNLEDLLICDFIIGGKEPLYNCSVIFGNQKEVSIKIPFSSSSLQIENCGNGCIQTYEWFTGADGYEEINNYLYDKDLNNWFQDKSSIQENGDTKEKIYNNEQWSIDALILKIKNKKNVLSLYENIVNKFKSKSFDEIKALILSVNIKSEKHFKEKDLRKYNDLAYYLEQSGAYKEAIFLLEKIIKDFPDRTVAYINLGDAYWGVGEKEKAKKAYNTYIHQMKKSGKEAKIPTTVLERI